MKMPLRFLAAVAVLFGYADLRAQDLFAVSSNEEVSYFSSQGSALGSVSFGVTVYGVAFDPHQNLIVDEFDSGPVRLSGTSTTGETQLSVGSSTPFYYGAAFDGAGNLYLSSDADTGNASDITVYKYNGDSGTPSLITDTGTNGSFSPRNTVAVDPVTGNIFVADFYQSKIYEYSSSGGTVPLATLSTGINEPSDIAIDKLGNLYVTNNGNDSLIKFANETGSPVTVDSNLGEGGGVAVDGSNDVFVLGFNPTNSHGYISEFSSGGTLLSGTVADLGFDQEGSYLAVETIPEPDADRLMKWGAIFALGMGGAKVLRKRESGI